MYLALRPVGARLFVSRKRRAVLACRYSGTYLAVIERVAVLFLQLDANLVAAIDRHGLGVAGEGNQEYE